MKNLKNKLLGLLEGIKTSFICIILGLSIAAVSLLIVAVSLGITLIGVLVGICICFASIYMPIIGVINPEFLMIKKSISKEYNTYVKTVGPISDKYIVYIIIIWIVILGLIGIVKYI